MSILKSEAIILSDMPYGETSKILRVFSKEYGRLSFIAKGSRKAKNRFGGTIDSLNRVYAVYYFKENRDLHTLTQCDVINPHLAIKKDFEKLSLGLAITEIIVRLVVEEEPNRPLYDLVTKTLNSLEAAEKNYGNVYWYFLTRFLSISGFGLNIDACQKCGTDIKIQSAYFSLSNGGIVCDSCANHEMDRDVSAETVQVLRALLRKQPGQLYNLRISQNSHQEIKKLFDDFFRYHFDGYVTFQATKLVM